MLHFMKLELRKSHMKHYIQASMVASIVLLVFIYFVAFVAQIEQEMAFQQYSNIYLLTSIVWMIFFSIVTAMMYWRVVVTEYKEQASSSTSQKAFPFSKMVWILCFSTIAMMCSIIPSFVVFSVTEMLFPIVHDKLTADIFFTLIKTFLVFTCCVNGIGMMAMRVGLMKKSIFITILTAIVLCAVLGNVSIAIYGNDQLNLVLSGVMIVAVLIVILELPGKMDRLQAR
ncbi:bacitracin ABC transporter permease [Bacillus sp. 28A-2]|uniref:bacitracin ABC transporter permease n=1 Tax=Bacillus sp. 28A-2 TaxID=2772252 RepID=UPI00168D59D3|nr:bacitracin ABC transporter permease [Bacillus sp. 28A-2]MBD3861571.1 bacitracin ABC transporter permease [Bacillus sp. 28A-2]